MGICGRFKTDKAPPLEPTIRLIRLIRGQPFLTIKQRPSLNPKTRVWPRRERYRKKDASDASFKGVDDTDFTHDKLFNPPRARHDGLQE
jgi:hypothetical protein